MPLVTQQTRLTQLNQAAQNIRATAKQVSDGLASPYAVDGLVRLASGLQEILNTIVADAMALDADQKAAFELYCDTQFATDNFGMFTRITGIKQLSEAIIAEIKRIVPVDSNGKIGTMQWGTGGLSTLNMLGTSTTATLKAMLLQLYNAIPE
jgi:hypothetical protein